MGWIALLLHRQVTMAARCGLLHRLRTAGRLIGTHHCTENLYSRCGMPGAHSNMAVADEASRRVLPHVERASCSAAMVDKGNEYPTLCTRQLSGNMANGCTATVSELQSPVMMADSRVVLVCGALLCFGGSVVATYYAITRDPNRK